MHATNIILVPTWLKEDDFIKTFLRDKSRYTTLSNGVLLSLPNTRNFR